MLIDVNNSVSEVDIFHINGINLWIDIPLNTLKQLECDGEFQPHISIQLISVILSSFRLAAGRSRC